MSDELMDDAQAVAEVCALGRRIEKELMEAEAEAELRSWKSMPNGGHDPELVRRLSEETSVAWGQLPDVLHGNQPKDGEGSGKEFPAERK